jgi:hypothetical protein
LHLGTPERATAVDRDPLATMLRVYLMQNWFSLSDPEMKDALCDMPALRQ